MTSSCIASNKEYEVGIEMDLILINSDLSDKDLAALEASIGNLA